MVRDRSDEFRLNMVNYQEDNDNDKGKGKGKDKGKAKAKGKGKSTLATIPESTSVQMEHFMKKVQVIQDQLKQISSWVEAVKQIYDTTLSEPQSDEMVKQQLANLTADISSLASKVRGELNDMKQMIVHQQQGDHQQQQQPASVRIYTTQHSALLQRFIDLMSYYNRIQVDYRERCKGQIRRQLMITGRMTNDAELEQWLECDNTAVFTQGILADTQLAKQALANIEARHSEIIKLEASIRELHELFLNMATLVEEQGETVTRIEAQVSMVAEYVEKGNDELQEAAKWHLKKQHKIALCVIIGVACVATLLSVLLIMGKII